MAPDSSRQSQEQADGVMPGDFLLRTSRSIFVKPNISEETPSAAQIDWRPAMSGIIHLVAGVSVMVGALGLIRLFADEEGHRSKSIAGTLTSAGFLLLAGVLNGYF
jgi:hypothetical protein